MPPYAYFIKCKILVLFYKEPLLKPTQRNNKVKYESETDMGRYLINLGIEIEVEVDIIDV